MMRSSPPEIYESSHPMPFPKSYSEEVMAFARKDGSVLPPSPYYGSATFQAELASGGIV